MQQKELSILIEKLNLQVKSFQEGFEVLSRSRNLKDLAKSFSHILRGNILTINVNIFYKKSKEVEWEELYLHQKDSKSLLEKIEVSSIIEVNSLADERVRLAVSLPLIDKSYFGLLIGMKMDKSDFTSFDRISIQIFLQLLANAYQAYLNQKKEKELIFSLNNRVLQLNSLIDTGIELSSLDKIESLLELALERAVVLTNASAGCVTIYEKKKELKFTSFPRGHDRRYLTDAQNK